MTMTEADTQKISAHYEEFIVREDPQAQRVAQLRAEIKDLEEEITSLEQESSASKTKAGACADLTLFHLALNHGDTEAAKQLVVSAAKANTNVSEDDTGYWLVLASENMGSASLEEAAAEGKVCFGRDDGSKDTVILDEFYTWKDFWADPWTAGCDDWIRPREHVEAYFEDKYHITGAYRLCSKKIDPCCSKK